VIAVRSSQACRTGKGTHRRGGFSGPHHLTGPRADRKLEPSGATIARRRHRWLVGRYSGLGPRVATIRREARRRLGRQSTELGRVMLR